MAYSHKIRRYEPKFQPWDLTQLTHTTVIIPSCFQFGGEPREKNEGNEGNELSGQPEPAKKEGKHKSSV
jgi:hypothetical protein